MGALCTCFLVKRKAEKAGKAADGQPGFSTKNSQLVKALRDAAFQLNVQNVLEMSLGATGPPPGDNGAKKDSGGNHKFAEDADCPFHSRRKNNLPAYSHVSLLSLQIRQQRSETTIRERTMSTSLPMTGSAPVIDHPQTQPPNLDRTPAEAAGVHEGDPAASRDPDREEKVLSDVGLNGGNEEQSGGSNQSANAHPSPRYPSRALLKVKASSIDQPDQARVMQARRDSARLHWSAQATNQRFKQPVTDSAADSVAILAAGGQQLNIAAVSGEMMRLQPSGLVHQYPNFASMFQQPGEAVRRNDEDDGYVYLNQYKLSNQTLGHGTYSIVKLAYNTEDNNHYAMKILSKKKLMKKHRMSRKSGDPMQEAYREIAILKKLNHPNIIRLIEVLDDPNDDSLYMAFELLERGEVLSVPTESPLPEPVVWRYFRDLILGVEYLHYNGIIHRDLKPSNLLLDDAGRLKIADFGLSHMFEGPDAYLGGTVGTPAFHAPEVLSAVDSTSSPTANGPRSGPNSRSVSPVENGKGAYSGTAMDIWSMGITLYSLIYGDVPFRDQFLVGLYNQIRTLPPKFPEEVVVSDELQDLINRLLEKDPTKRISISEMREHPWVTRGGSQALLPSTAENCTVPISVTDEDIRTSVRSIPHLDTLILIKAMLKRGSFHHPFKSEDARKGSLDSNLPYSKAADAR